ANGKRSPSSPKRTHSSIFNLMRLIGLRMQLKQDATCAVVEDLGTLRAVRIAAIVELASDFHLQPEHVGAGSCVSQHGSPRCFLSPVSWWKISRLTPTADANGMLRSVRWKSARNGSTSS